MSISNEEKEGSWSNLHVELLDLIMRRLSFFDQLSFRAVCKSWRSINRRPNQIPWIMLVGDTDKYSWSSCEVTDLTTKKAYTISLSSIRKRKKKVESMEVHESKYGWLMISSYHRKLFYTSRSLYLFTPFRNHNNLIELPTPKYFEFATFSTDPDRKDCLFLTIKRVIKNKRNILSIKTCRRGDNSWRTQNIKCDLTVTMIKAWMYSEGILYYADGKGRVRGLDITRQSTPGSTTHVLPKIPNLPGNGCICVDMVKLDGVLLVLLRGSFSVSHFSRLYGIDIRLDSSLMTWKEIIYEYTFESLQGNINPKITLVLRNYGGYRSFLKFSEDRQVEIVDDCSRAFLLDNSPVLHISLENHPNMYWIDHPLACS